MKKIVLFFCFLITNILHASTIPVDTIHDPAFQKKVDFYLKYGTRSETQTMMHALTTLDEQNKIVQVSLNDGLFQAQRNYINANNQILVHTQKVKTMMPADEYYSLNHEVAIAQQDALNAWFTYQFIVGNKHEIEKDSIKIGGLLQAMAKREVRLIKRRLTDQQQSLIELQRQSHLIKSSKKENVLTSKARFIKSQEKAKDSLNRMIKQSLTIQATQAPASHTLDEYITQAKQQSQLTEEKKQRKAELQAQKLRDNQERRKLNEQKAQEMKIFQSLAIQKGPSQQVAPSQQEREKQSIKDKEIAQKQSAKDEEMAKEQYEVNLMRLEDKSTTSSALTNVGTSKATDQNTLDNITMLLSRLKSQEDSKFHPENPHEQDDFLTAVVELEDVIDENAQLFNAKEPSDTQLECTAMTTTLLKHFRSKLQAIESNASIELQRQKERSAKIASLNQSDNLTQKQIKFLLPLEKAALDFDGLTKQDYALRKVIKITEQLNEKLKGTSTSLQSIKHYKDSITSQVVTQGSPFVDENRIINKYTFNPMVNKDARTTILDMTSPNCSEQEKQNLTDFISKQIACIFPEYDEKQIRKRALYTVTQGIKEFQNFQLNAPKFKDEASAIEYAKKQHVDQICYRIILLNKNNNLSQSDISILTQLECIIFESYFSYYCSNLKKYNK